MSTSTNLDERPVSRPPDVPPPETVAELATATADERAANALLAQAGAMLRERATDVPDDFAAQLFGRAAAEDLIRYEAAELADVATATWHFLAERKPLTRRSASRRRRRKTVPGSGTSPSSSSSMTTCRSWSIPSWAS